MRLPHLLCLLSAVGLAAPASAADAPQLRYYSGSDLFDALRSDSDRQPVGIGYVAGVVDAVNGRPTPAGDCFRVPDKTAARQLGEAVTRWLDRNAAGRSDNAAAVVAKALQEAYPCK